MREGTFAVSFDGQSAAPLAYNATATQVAAALEALGSVDDVTVTGNGGGPWTVTFGGTQSGTNVSRMDGDASNKNGDTQNSDHACGSWAAHLGGD